MLLTEGSVNAKELFLKKLCISYVGFLFLILFAFFITVS